MHFAVPLPMQMKLSYNRNEKDTGGLVPTQNRSITG